MSDLDPLIYALSDPPECRRCGRKRSVSAGCPKACPCQHCHGRKCKGECVAVATMDAAVRGKR